MEWTKVSVKYAELIFSDASDSVFRTYIRLMLLVVSMEFAPTLPQLYAKLGKRKVQTLIKFLGEKDIKWEGIVSKVMEDVIRVSEKREQGKARQRKHRCNALHNAPVTPVDKIREDKIKDKNKYKGKDSHTKVNKSIKINKTYREFVSMTEIEHQKLLDKHGVNWVNTALDTLNVYKGSSGKKYKSDYMAILGWVTEKLADVKSKTPGGRQIQEATIDPEIRKAYMKRIKEKEASEKIN